MIKLGIEITVPKSPRIRLSESLALGRMGAEAARRIKRRVRDQAQDADGQSFGSYYRSPKTLYVPKGGTQRFEPPRGGIDAGQFQLFEGGYPEYRAKLGKGGKVNFNLTGDMWSHQRVQVRLVFGYPVVIIGFQGYTGQRPRQDYFAQMVAKQKGEYTLERRVKGRLVKTRHTLGARARKADPRPATPASKAAFQRVRGQGLRWFMEMSQGELVMIRNMAMKDIAKVLKQRWQSQTLPK